MICPSCNYEMGSSDLVCPRCKARGTYRMRPRQAAPPTIVNNVYVNTPPAPAPAPMHPVTAGLFAVIGAWLGAQLLGAAGVATVFVSGCGCVAFFALLALLGWVGSHMH